MNPHEEKSALGVGLRAPSTGSTAPDLGRVIPFPARSAGSLGDATRQRDADEGEDWPLVVCLLMAFTIAFTRVVYAIAHREVFGADAALALVGTLVIPLLLRPWFARLRR